MNIHDILLILQYITVGVLFIEICIVLIGWKNKIHSYLFLACIATFISNIGYLLEMQAGSQETYITALKLSYAGRVWIVFAFFLFSAQMCRRKLPKGLIAFLALVNVCIYITILMIGTNDLYYPSYQFDMDFGYAHFYHTNGIAHNILMGLNAVYAFFGIFWVILEYRKEKHKKVKQSLFVLILSFGVQIICFALHMTKAFEITEYYDLTMFGALLGTIFMLIGIFGFDLLKTGEIARDFIIDRITEGIIAVDIEGNIQYYNAPITKLYKSSNTVKTPYDVLSLIVNAISKNESITIGERIYAPEENELIYKGANYGKLYVLVDDTEHYHYMQELQKQRDIADSANEAKSRFLASMSHEIRTPINAVIGMDEMILRESREKNICSYASDIMSAGRTLLSLINDILDLSKVEEGKMDIIPVQYDLSSLINDLVNVIRDRALDKGLNLIVEVETKTPNMLIGDEIRIRQCVMNLLTNAVKYTKEGEVTFKVSFEKIDEGHINLCFRVEDTGIGMRKEDMENLFSPYKRIEEKRNRRIEGTGLGMSITRQLLELMESELKVQSEYGKGSVFSFAISQEVYKWDEIGDVSARINNMSVESYEYHELFHAPNARILVVDDTEVNLTVIQSLLKKTLVQIDTAMSGAKALELAKDNLYDVVFIDHMMPDMDGIETLKALRELEINKDVIAIALTANAVSGARDMYIEAGFTDYLSKPVDGTKLEKMLMEKLPDDKVETSYDSSDNSLDDSSAEADQPRKTSDQFQDIDEIDKQAGIMYCGDEDSYMSVLSVFHMTASEKADEIENLYKAGDIEKYTIKVHALKSSARIIGAAKLSELAKELEAAGERKDMEFIDANTNTLLDMYRSLDAKLSWLDQSDDNLPKIDDKSLKEAYQAIAEIAYNMDYGLMEEMLKNIRGYSLPKPDKERIDSIEKMLRELDWEGIAKEVGNVQ
ncbi:MAG: response regulator [Lachnospiraceae bacterium]|nr:response regulator [Lachnospiraceae bacterium]